MQRGATGLGRQALLLGVLAAPAPFAVDMFLPALPQITASLGASVTATQATLTAYFLAFGLAHLIYGPWSDAKGRLPVLRAGLVVFLVGTAGCAVAPNVEALIAARMVQAAGAAALMVIPRAIIRDSLMGRDATCLTARLMLVLSVAPLFAPLAGSAILLLGDWRLIFVLLLAGGGISYGLTHAALRETLPPIERYPISGRTLYVGLRRLFRDRVFVGLTLLASFGLANFFVFVASAPYVYHAVFGLGHVAVSLALAVNGIGFFVTAQAAAPLSDKYGADRAMLWGTAGFALCVAALGLAAQTVPLGVVPLVGGIALANACLGITVPTALARALEPHGPIAGMAASVAGAIQMGITGAMILIATLFLAPDVPGLIAATLLCAALVLATAMAILRPRVGPRRWADSFER